MRKRRMVLDRRCFIATLLLVFGCGLLAAALLKSIAVLTGIILICIGCKLLLF